jgi:hypothetical protein
MAGTAYPVTSVLWKGFVEEGPVPADNFVVSSGAAALSSGDLQEGQVLLQLLYLSVDP